MIGFLATALFFGSTPAPVPAATPAPEWLASQRCTHAVIQRTPGRFLSGHGAQQVEVDRGLRVGEDGVPVCRFGISIVDAHRNDAGRYLLGVGTDVGAGLTPRDGVWKPGDWQMAYNVQVMRLKPFGNDQLLISERASRGDEENTIVSVVNFPSAFPTAVPLLKVKNRGRLDVQVLPASIMITGFQQTGGCNACGRYTSIELKYDAGTRTMALVDPTPGKVAFYHQIHLKG
jgi:hypothetical protein